MRKSATINFSATHMTSLCFVLIFALCISSPAHTESQSTNHSKSPGASFTPKQRVAIEEKVEEYRLSSAERARQVLEREFLRGRLLLLTQTAPHLAAFKRPEPSGNSPKLSNLTNVASVGKLEKLFIENLPVVAIKNYLSLPNIDVTFNNSISEAQRPKRMIEPFFLEE